MKWEQRVISILNLKYSHIVVHCQWKITYLLEIPNKGRKIYPKKPFHLQILTRKMFQIRFVGTTLCKLNCDGKISRRCCEWPSAKSCRTCFIKIKCKGAGIIRVCTIKIFYIYCTTRWHWLSRFYFFLVIIVNSNPNWNHSTNWFYVNSSRPVLYNSHICTIWSGFCINFYIDKNCRDRPLTKA